MMINGLSGSLSPNSDLSSPWITILSALPNLKTIKQLLGSARDLFDKITNNGVYEVLDYESTLEIKDPDGRGAVFKKVEKVRYLQDNIIAYQDQAWGDGKTLIQYRCKPGIPVDRYRSGYKTHILISLREVKAKGDIDNFNIEWKIRAGFLEKSGFWATEISHRTKQVSVSLIFPKSRPPLSISLVERNSQKNYALDDHLKMQLPDGRWSITWRKTQPRQFEQYILRWEW